MPNEREIKSLDMEVKAASSSDGKMKFSGYLSVFNKVDECGDMVLQGAFKDTLRDMSENEKFLPVLENHGGWRMGSPDLTPIGFFQKLEEDQYGLKFDAVLYSTARGKEIHSIMRESPKGFVGMSIGYIPKEVEYPSRDETAKTGVERYLKTIKLLEGSVTVFPMEPNAKVDSVKMSEALMCRDIERLFRDNGFSSKDAVKIVSLLKNSFGNSFPTSKVDKPKPSIKEAEKTLSMIFKKNTDFFKARNALLSVFK